VTNTDTVALTRIDSLTGWQPAAARQQGGGRGGGPVSWPSRPIDLCVPRHAWAYFITFDSCVLHANHLFTPCISRGPPQQKKQQQQQQGESTYVASALTVSTKSLRSSSFSAAEAWGVAPRKLL